MIMNICVFGAASKTIDEKYIKQILDTLYLFVYDKSKIERLENLELIGK